MAQTEKYRVDIDGKSLQVRADVSDSRLTMSIPELDQELEVEVEWEENVLRLRYQTFEERVEVQERSRGLFHAVSRGIRHRVEIEEMKERRGTEGGPRHITAPIPGRIILVNTADGREVGEGETLFVIESMKMENEVRSPVAGTVSSVRVEEGESVSADHVLAEVEGITNDQEDGVV